MAFSFTPPPAVASVKDVGYDFAFDFLQEAVLIKSFLGFSGVFFPGFCGCLFTLRARGRA